MKFSKKIFALMVTVVFLCISISVFPVSADVSNLITNGDFETLNAAGDYPSYWNLSGNSVGKDEASGNHFLSMSGGGITTQTISTGIKEMTTYEFRGLTKSSSTVNSLLTVTYGRLVEDTFQTLTNYSATEPTIAFMKNPTNTGLHSEESIHFKDGITNWHEVVFSFITPPHTTAVRINLRSSATDANVTWDNVSLVEKADANLVNYGTAEYGLVMSTGSYVTAAKDPQNSNNNVIQYTGTTASPGAGKSFEFYLLGGRNYVFEFDFYADSTLDSNTPTTVNPRMVVNMLALYKTDASTYGGAFKAYDFKTTYTVQSNNWVHCKTIIRATDDAILRRVQVVPRPAAIGTYYYDNVVLKQDATSTKFYNGTQEVTTLPESGTVNAVCHFVPDAYVTTVNPVFVVGVYKTEGTNKKLVNVYVKNGTTTTGDSFDMTVSSIPVEENITLEAMAWKDFGSMTPYIAKEVIQ